MPFLPDREETYVYSNSICVCHSVLNRDLSVEQFDCMKDNNINIIEMLTLSFINLLSGVRFSCSFLFRCLSPTRAELLEKEIIRFVYSRWMDACRLHNRTRQLSYLRFILTSLNSGDAP